MYEDELIPLFEKCGKIWDLRLMMDPMTSTNRGYAFITFVDRESAQRAVREVCHTTITPISPLIIFVCFIGKFISKKKNIKISKEKINLFYSIFLMQNSFYYIYYLSLINLYILIVVIPTFYRCPGHFFYFFFFA